VGFSSTCGLFNPLVLHWDGTKWSVVRTPSLPQGNNNQLMAVFAVATDDVYAVGTQTNPVNEGNLTLVEHWDGTSWNVVSTPSANDTGNVLLGLFAHSADDVWAVGDAVSPNNPVETEVLHFDGTQWSLVPSPNPITNSNLDQNVLNSVTATSPDDATAVGFVLDFLNQVTLTLVEHWDGKSWSVVSSPNRSKAANSLNRLNGVTAVSASDVYAAGFFADAATFGQERSLVEHFDRVSWKIIPNPNAGKAQQLNAVVGLAGTTNVWIGGAASSIGDDSETGFLIVPKTFLLFSPIG